MSYAVENQILSIMRYKAKLFDKLLSLEAQIDHIKRAFTASEVKWFYTLWQSYMELVTILVLAVEYMLGMTDFQLLHAEWDYDYPTIDELVRGVFLHLHYRTLEDVFRDFMQKWMGEDVPEDVKLDYDRSLQYFLETKIYPALWNPSEPLPVERRTISSMENIVYRIRYLLRSPTVLRFSEELLQNLNIPKVVVEKIEAAELGISQGFFLDFNILDYSRFSDKEVRDGVEYAVITDRKGNKIYVYSIDHLVFGTILDLSRLDATRLTELKAFAFAMPTPYFSYWRAMRQWRRIVSPATALLMARPYREMKEEFYSTPTLVYGQLRAIVNLIRKHALGVIGDEETNPIKRNMYAFAALEAALFTRFSHLRSVWYKKQIPEEDFKRTWLEKWKALGLKEDLLLRLYEAMKNWRRAVLVR